MSSNRNRRTGASQTEYVIVVCLVAIAVLSAVKFFGRTVQRHTLGARNEVEIELEVR